MAESDLAGSFYGRAAGVYDRVATAPVVRSWRDRCVAELDPGPGDTVADMGCGTGATLTALREAVGPEGTVVGVDIVAAMLRRARRRIAKHGWGNVRLVQGDATRPPVGSVDGLVSTFVVGMFDDPGDAVRAWVRAVRPGGRVVLLNAVRTDRRRWRPLNPVFRLWTRLAAPNDRLTRGSPARRLERRWNDSVDALFEHTVDPTTDRLGGGFVVLASGRVPG